MCVGMWCELLLGGDPPPRWGVLTVVCGDVVWVAGMFFV